MGGREEGNVIALGESVYIYISQGKNEKGVRSQISHRG